MAKSPDAFRTISEVAEWLGIQAHVLRFWESKFTQVKPVKRAGGRRYYRPGDMLLLGGIKQLLYEDGLTIKGVQKILREEGMAHVSDLSPPLDELTLSQLDDVVAPTPQAVELAEPEEKEPRGVVVSFDAPPEPPEREDVPSDTPPAPAPDLPPPPTEPPHTPAPAPPAADANPTESAAAKDNAALPAFLRRPSTPEPETPEASKPEIPAAEVAPPEPARPKPRIVDVPPPMPEAEIPAEPALLSSVYRKAGLSADSARQMTPLLARLAAHRDQMASQRRVPPKP